MKEFHTLAGALHNTNRKKKLFQYQTTKFKSGYIKHTFNFFSNNQYKNLFNQILNTIKENNIPKQNLINAWKNKTDISINKAHKILHGTETIELWEFIEVLNTLNLQIQITNTNNEKYKVSKQEANLGTQIIIHVNTIYKFNISFNINQPLLFNVEFIKTNIAKSMSIKKLNTEIRKALNFYFTKKLPYTQTQLSAQIQILHATNKIKGLNV